jgi:hypothetical protein
MKKIAVFFTVLLLVFIFPLISCKDDSDGTDETPLAQDEADQLASDVMTTANAEILQSSGGLAGSGDSGKALQSENISYDSGDGAVITGYFTTDSDNLVYAKYQVNCVFTNYSAPGIVINGTITCVLEVDINYFYYSYSGDLIVTQDGETYNMSFNLIITIDSGSFSSSGYYSINGYQYTYSYSSFY